MTHAGWAFCDFHVSSQWAPSELAVSSNSSLSVIDAVHNVSDTLLLHKAFEQDSQFLDKGLVSQMTGPEWQFANPVAPHLA